MPETGRQWIPGVSLECNKPPQHLIAAAYGRKSDRKFGGAPNPSARLCLEAGVQPRCAGQGGQAVAAAQSPGACTGSPTQLAPVMQASGLDCGRWRAIGIGSGVGHTPVPRTSCPAQATGRSRSQHASSTHHSRGSGRSSAGASPARPPLHLFALTPTLPSLELLLAALRSPLGAVAFVPLDAL